MPDALPQSWHGVEPRHLAAFRAVAHHRCFRAAARALGYSQPTISHLVGELERILAMPLFERQPGSNDIELTDRGEVLLRHAAAILHSIGAAQADLRTLAGERLQVGMLASLAPRLLGPVLEAINERPGIVEAADDDQLATLVADGQVEMAFGAPPPRPGPFDVHRFAQDPYVLAIPPDWCLVLGGDRPAHGLLEHLPLITPPDGLASAHNTEQLRARGIKPRWGTRADSDAAALALVRAGTGAAIVAHSAIEPWDGSIAQLPLDGILAPRAICWYVHRDRRLSEDIEVIASAAAAAHRTTQESLATTQRNDSRPRG